MFSGIIEELGVVKIISRQGSNCLFEIKTVKALEGTKIGESISVNGVCATVIKITPDSFAFEAMPETTRITNLGNLKVQDRVNLERSLRVGDRISGHFVTGHVDCLGIIRKKSYVNGNLCVQIAVPLSFMKYCIPKGSIAIDGISLTLVEGRGNLFTVYIIPHTLGNTTLGFKGPSDRVNIEFDVLVKKTIPPV